MKIIDLDDDCYAIETVNCRWKKDYTNFNKRDKTLSQSITDLKDETDSNRVSNLAVFLLIKSVRLQVPQNVT